MKTVIFGCGYMGRYTLNFIGRDRIDLFCDNNSNVWGSEIDGIKVISYKELLELYNEEQVILIVGVINNGNNQETIIEQLESDGITDYIVAEVLPGIDCASQITDEDFESLFCREKRQEYFIKYLRMKLMNTKKQVEYFKKHASIRHMSPAVGKLRQEQLNGVKESRDALDFLEKNIPSIKCWITAGTLIGKLRHNGFIPWDYDLDFGIMREDAYRVLDFFRKYSIVYIAGDDFPTSDDENELGEKRQKTIWEVAEDYKGKYFIRYYPDYIRIHIKYDSEIVTALELFTFDYYADDLSIEDYQKYVSEGFMMKKNLPSHKEVYNWCYDKINNSGIVSEKPTNKILPGIDSFSYAGLWTIKKFLPADVLFPLHEVEFEGEKFYCVNQPEIYMEHEYPDWESFPHDVGAHE